MKAPISPKYEPVMKLRWTCTRPVTAAHTPIDRVPKVNTDNPWIQLKCPGLSSLMTNELSTVQYIAATHTQPTQRCVRSPFAARTKLYAPSAIAVVALPACSAITMLLAITPL